MVKKAPPKKQLPKKWAKKSNTKNESAQNKPIAQKTQEVPNKNYKVGYKNPKKPRKHTLPYVAQKNQGGQ